MNKCGFIDKCINQLIKNKEFKKHPNIQVLLSKEIENILAISKEIISSQPIFLHLVAPLVVCGDIHGNYFDLLRIFEKCGDPSKTNYLFLGDYIDRGKYSINTMILLLLYKIKYPLNFFLLRGNHETKAVNKQYGFYEECENIYNSNIWNLFNTVFDYFPIAALIDKKIFCIHGGISPRLKNLKQLNKIKRPLRDTESGLVGDLLWSDPNKEIENFAESKRGNGVFFGQNLLQNFLDNHNLDLLVRSHQLTTKGYEFPFYPKQTIVSIFSSPNYGGQSQNSGAVMIVHENLACEFSVFEPIVDE